MVGEMAKRIPMSKWDVNRAEILNAVVEEKVTLKYAAKRLRVSYRQAKRLLKRYREEGAAGIVHRNVGKHSHRKIDEKTRQRVLALHREKYSDFGPTLAAEKLLERDGIRVDHETLRRWLIAEGMHDHRRRRRVYRSRRQRRERFGELVQFDGSHHEWFEQRGRRSCLMNMVDDATGTTFARMSEEETTEAAMWLLWGWIERHGIPQAVYCDRKNSFLIDREPTIEEQLSGTVPMSPFELACERLGIEVIAAGSPQAKGRVERSHGVYQDRFVKELRLADINTIEQANRFLIDTYLPSINSKFAVEPQEPEDAHVPLMQHPPLEDIFCFEEQRVVSRDYVIRYHNRLFQLTRTPGKRLPSPSSKVTVRRRLDKSVHILCDNKSLAYEEITPRHEEERSPRPA